MFLMLQKVLEVEHDARFLFWTVESSALNTWGICIWIGKRTLLFDSENYNDVLDNQAMIAFA